MVAVTYYCPRCGALAELDRDAYLADKSVTPYPLDGWEYVTVDEEYEDADGVRLVCGGRATVEGGDETGGANETGCGEPFYLSFVRFEDGKEIEARPPAEYVAIGAGVGSQGPNTPGGPNLPSQGER
ncbi:MAG: hypothetical protein QXG03_02180 [Halalkalicoccus sp.]